MIKAVAFDMDGLMFDTEDLYWTAAERLLGRRGFVYTAELNTKIMGRPPQACFELFKSTFDLPETWQELRNESEEIFLELLREGYAAMPGLYELLDLLERFGTPKGICTSSSRRVVDEVLRRDDLATRFEFVMTAEDIVQGKPNPEIYLKAAERFGIEPGDMLVLEDSEAGCRAAAAAGAFSVVVLARHNADGDFSPARMTVDRLDAPEVRELLFPSPSGRGLG